MKTDSLFYRLFKRMPGLVVELAKLDCPTHGYKFQSQEIKQTSFRLDGVLTPITPGGEQPIIFIEVQFRSDKGFYGRFFSEIFLYLRQYNPPFPWRAVVLYPDRATEQDAGLHFRSLLKLPEVHRVYLEDFLEGVGDSPALRLIKLIVCPLDQTAKRTRWAITLTAPLPMPADEWLDFIETILVYKLPQLTREEIKEMIGLQDIDLKQTRVYQDALGEGRQEGELTIVQRLLERHFGPLPNTITERLRRLDAAQLEALSDVLLDLRSLNELNDWLLAR